MAPLLHLIGSGEVSKLGKFQVTALVGATLQNTNADKMYTAFVLEWTVKYSSGMLKVCCIVTSKNPCRQRNSDYMSCHIPVHEH